MTRQIDARLAHIKSRSMSNIPSEYCSTNNWSLNKQFFTEIPQWFGFNLLQNKYISYKEWAKGGKMSLRSLLLSEYTYSICGGKKIWRKCLTRTYTQRKETITVTWKQQSHITNLISLVRCEFEQKESSR